MITGAETLSKFGTLTKILHGKAETNGSPQPILKSFIEKSECSILFVILLSFIRSAMKITQLLICLLLIHASSIGQKMQIVQLEHSLRWLSQENFPNYLSNPETESSLYGAIENHLKEKTGVSEVIFPGSFDYRVISGFGKSKIKMPKPNPAEYDVAISSAITRGTTNYKVLWNMSVKVRHGKQTIIEKEVEHELEPYSLSVRMSNKPWLDDKQFAEIFIRLLEECLGMKDYLPSIITLGSFETIRENISKLMPIEKKYTLATSGPIMQQSSSAYKILIDSIELSDFSFRPTDQFNIDFSVSGNRILADLFSQLTGIDAYYNLKSKEKRTGAIYTQDGVKRKVRLDWLEKSRMSTGEDEALYARYLSPITGAFFDQDQLISEFIFYKQITEVKDMSLHNMHFQMGDDDLADKLYAILGTYNGNKFEVVYREMDAFILIKLLDNLEAVMALINVNPDSKSAGGLKLSKNKVTMTSTQKLTGSPIVDVPIAEWYPLFTRSTVTDEMATEMGYFILLLFFAIGNAG